MRRNRYISYALVYFSYFFAMGIFGSILSVYLSEHGKSTSDISLIVSAAGIFTMVLQPIIGAVYDKTKNDRWVSIALMLLSGVFGVLFAATRGTLALFLLNGFSMAFLNSINPVFERMATGSRFRYGAIRLWGAIGYATSTQIAGIVFDRVFPEFNFYLFGVAVAVTIIGFYGIRSDKRDAREKANDNAGSRSIVKTLFTNRAFLLFTAVGFLFSGAAAANSTFLPLLLTDMLGSATNTGTVLLLATLMELPVILLSHKFMNRLSNRALLIANFSLLMLQFAIYAITPVSWVVCLAVLICKSTATMLFIMVTLKVVLNLVDDSVSTTALSVVATAKAIGGVVVNYLSGFLADAFSLRATFAMLLAVSAVGLVLAATIKLPSRENELF